MKSKHDLVRKVLRDSADGLTVKQITEAVGVDKDPLSRILQTMPDAYIDR
jgi:predicted Zn-ribbon and HTH transcriptional regulator